MYMSSPVVADGVLYGLTQRNRGQFFAVDVATGKTLWTSPGRQGENAALAVAGGVIIATTTDGELVVFRQNRKGFELVRNTPSPTVPSGRIRRSRRRHPDQGSRDVGARR